MRQRLVTTPRERHRELDADIRDLLREAEHLHDRARNLAAELSEDRLNREAAGRVSAAMAAFGTATWLLRGARSVLP